MNTEQKQLLIEAAARVMRLLYQADQETTAQELVYDLESLFAEAYDISREEIHQQLRASGFEVAPMVNCFVCAAEIPENQAVKIEVADGINSYLCPSCDQIRQHGKSELREYTDLSENEKSLLRVVQGK